MTGPSAMSRPSYQFTSESVSEGHPDKVCDRISDAVVDLLLGKDPQARVACETLTTTNQIVLAGEIRCAEPVSDAEIEAVARAAVKDIGYEQEGFHWEKSNFTTYLHEQSTDIAQGVDASGNKDEGAGDQGIMFGYACDETAQLMPAPILFSHKILQELARQRKSGARPELEPDAKSQVTLRYENGKPVAVESVVVSTQHREGVSTDDVREIVRPVVKDVLGDLGMPPENEFYVNPTGTFVIGGGAFSGKDPTKVDRSAAYASRYLAKNVVAAGIADRCLIQVSYAIGVSKPLSVFVDLYDTGNVDPAALEKALQEVMDLSPRGIREHLGLNRPIYERSAAYGHFGREPDADGGFSWERTDLVDALKSALGA